MNKHIPVLKKEVTETFSYLGKIDNPVFVDGTIGNAGHSISLIQNLKFKIQNGGITIVGIDKDESAIAFAKENADKADLSDHFIFVNDDFKNIKKILEGLNIEKIDGALIDLGVSSMQLDDKSRGFSFSDSEAVLDMRMDQKQDLDARIVINEYSEEALVKIFFDYGEEKYAKPIAKNISKQRRIKPIETVGELLSAIELSLPEKEKFKGGKHFATKTFQAIRIEVNKELIGLDRAIRDLVDLLTSSSRLAIISFHSLEDRIVKNTLKELATECICPPDFPICKCDHRATIRTLTKKPIIPSAKEIESNARSRSAKLRIVQKL